MLMFTRSLYFRPRWYHVLLPRTETAAVHCMPMDAVQSDTACGGVGYEYCCLFGCTAVVDTKPSKTQDPKRHERQRPERDQAEALQENLTFRDLPRRTRTREHTTHSVPALRRLRGTHTVQLCTRFIMEAPEPLPEERGGGWVYSSFALFISDVLGTAIPGTNWSIPGTGIQEKNMDLLLMVVRCPAHRNPQTQAESKLADRGRCELAFTPTAGIAKWEM